MSDSHYWPGPDQPGTYTLEHHAGAVWRDANWDGKRWANKWSSFDPLEVLSWGYLGVRREQTSTPDLTALVREAIAEFRETVKQPTQAADWAFKWVNRFIEVVELK